MVVSGEDGGTQVRTQLPLRLCWAITMHKSQGQTLAKAVIDLGPKEACTGLTFVCLSRAKRLVDLMVEPMSFDRIGNLGNSPTMKARLQEEVRLGELAQSTRVKYTDMGVFSAVAETDREALAALSLWTGSRWRADAYWDTDYHIGSWYGVQANDERRIERLELGSNNLRGIFVHRGTATAV
ncbi:unnamed protein product [Ectocarpus sp. CCAP 1310/34]|nr:unnamed protein product [Ectocarpus sp. CCAP 1310/34]